MAELHWRWQNFSGGQATDKKVGIPNSFAFSQSLDFRKSPSQMSVLPRTDRVDGGAVTDLIQNMVMTSTGMQYAVGNGGNIYRINPANSVTLFGSISVGTFGIEYREDQDTIYVADETSVSVIRDVSITPTLSPNFYNESQSTYNNTDQTGFNVNSDQNIGDKTTQLTTSYVDLAMNQTRYFQTDIQPVNKLGVKVATKGTGDWTLTVHDGLNRVLGTATVTNANIPVSDWVYFNFATPFKANVGPNNAQTYHFHLTSTTGNGSVYSTILNDLSSCDMQLFADRLEKPLNGMHPMITFQQFLCIGNGRYLSVYEPLGQEQPSNSEWMRQKLTFPPGYEVCGLTVFNEYLAIATERVSTGSNTPQEGIIFYWDGLSDTYNYFTRIPEGSPRAIHEYQNAMWYEAGGTWYAITSVAATPTKIRRLPGSENIYSQSGKTELYPYMATVRYGIHLMGWPSSTPNEEIHHGVYSWGRTDDTQSNSFGYSYIISTLSKFKTSTNNLTIGMVKNFGDSLYISWRDGESYGLDVVNSNSKPAPFASWESIIFDNGFSTKLKLASNMLAKWLEVQDGVEIQLKYSVDRGDWVYSEKYSNANPYALEEDFARFDVGTNTVGTRFREVQIGIDIYCSDDVTLPPEIVGAALILDDLRNEDMI